MPATKKTAAKKTAAPTKPGVKKTQAKTAAIVKAVVKNITEPKTATKKTSATKSTSKPATKATSLSKSTSKTTPATKTVVTELSVSGNKKIGTLMKEFNKKFPYLRLKICYSYARKAVANGESISGIDIEKTLASVRRADSGGDISISGNKKIKSLETEFDTVFGLYAQVCYTAADGHRYYTSGSADDKTLSAFNAECEKNGCKKGAWK